MPPSFVGGGGFISSFDTQRVTHCTPVQSIHNVINPHVQKLLNENDLYSPTKFAVNNYFSMNIQKCVVDFVLSTQLERLPKR